MYGFGIGVLSVILSFFKVSDANVMHFLVPDRTTAFIALGVAVVTAVVTYMTGGEDKRFEGVPEGDKIAQRQKMIAEVEKKYGEA